MLFFVFYCQLFIVCISGSNYFGWGNESYFFLLLFTYEFVISLPLGTWYGLCYFVVALAGPSINHLES